MEEQLKIKYIQTFSIEASLPRVQCTMEKMSMAVGIMEIKSFDYLQQ
ncbi:MAG: hypothetical protein WKG06_12730 [Segetibacter sp.]